jgi:hypothetical protein
LKKLIVSIGCILIITGCDSDKKETIILNLQQQLSVSKNKVQETQERLNKAQNQNEVAAKQLEEVNAKLAYSERILMFTKMFTNVNGQVKEDRVALYGEPGGDSFELKINEAIVESYAKNLDGDFHVVDINPNDQIKEIAISEAGPSSDDATYYYYLNRTKNEIVFMGKLQGKGKDIEYHWGGLLITHHKRGSIIQTWFHDQTYKLNAEHLLEEVPQDLYNMNTKVKITKELQLYKTRNSNEKAFKIQPGTDAVIVSSDDKRWSLIQASDGAKGWFEVEGYNTIKGTKGSVDDYMSGLIQAD